ncbi:MAG: hypothetical protein ACTHL1_03255 [Burkholderiaceae bacterium]
MPSSKRSSIRPSVCGRVAFWGGIAFAALDVRVAAAGVTPPPRPVGSEAVVVQPGEPHHERGERGSHAHGKPAQQGADAGGKNKPPHPAPPAK